MKQNIRKWTAEALGTFALVFAGTGAIVIDNWTGGTIGHAGIALTFGLVVMAMIYTFGDVSGAHINPAVTLGFVAAGRMPVSEAPGYIFSQLVGAFAASGCLRLLFPNSITLGETLPAGHWSQSFVLEVILTAILMITILGSHVCRPHHRSLNEPGSLTGSGHHRRSLRAPLALSRSDHHRRHPRRAPRQSDPCPQFLIPKIHPPTQVPPAHPSSTRPPKDETQHTRALHRQQLPFSHG